jgi:trehalose 6-phosphate synthase
MTKETLMLISGPDVKRATWRTTRAKTSPLIVLANRAPFRHEASECGTGRRVRTASGLVTAVEPLLLASAGTWVAHGEEADLAAADPLGRITVRSSGSDYALKYVGVDPTEYEGYYCGFANEALWPLCHSANVPATYRASDYAHYESVNRRFATAVCEEAAGRSPVVLVQDYHFALAPRWIRRGLPDAAIVAFWHIPWPHPHLFRSCPWSRQLLEGLLASDIVGLQTDEDCRHFLDAVTLLLRGNVDYADGSVEYRGRTTRVRAYPVGIEWNAAALRGVPPALACRERVHREHNLRSGIRIIAGVDRMDYTKGIARKFEAVERLLERRADLHRRLVLVQVAEPSRQSLDAYRASREEAVAAADRVNARFGDPDYRPILLLERHFEQDEVYTLYRASDVCFVNSLDDGMNLVAKEFVAARDDERGVLVLSEFAGASRQLADALIVNPYVTARSARSLEQALQMGEDEQARRMRSMRRVVAATDSTWWANQLLHDASLVRNATDAIATFPNAPQSSLRDPA